MAIKWKNTVKKLPMIVKKEWKIISGGAAIIAGLVFLWNIVADRTYHPTEEAIFFGILGNLFLGTGIVLILRRILDIRYAEWNPADEAGYEAWRSDGRMFSRRLSVAGIIAAAGAAWYLFYLMGGGVWNGGGWHWNYASGYILIFTALIQYILCRAVISRFRDGQLDQIMQSMARINQKRLEEALEIEKKSLEKVSRSDQLRIDLITNVSHDLKTPLTSMVGYLELMKKEDLGGAARDYVDVISDRAEKLKEMINSLFNLAKASSGNVELHPERFEVNRLIEQILADMDDQIRESDLEFITRFTEEDTELVSDNSYFYRICQNLIENALKYSAKGTRVFIKTYIKKKNDKTPGISRLCVEITNTAGYPMDFTKEDIVERFARGDKARSSEGNGLGLAIVSTYAKALGGEFDIRIDCDQFKACLEFALPEESSFSSSPS